MTIDARTAFQQLSSNPLSFLQTYGLWVQGNATHPSGVLNFEILDAAPFMSGTIRRPGTHLGTARMHETQTFMVSHASLGFGGHPFSARWLKMSEWVGAPSIYDISVLDLDLAGPPLMFTAGLTGCSVAIQDIGGGRLAVAHVRPNSDMNGVASGGSLDGLGVHTVLRRSGWTSVFGRHDYGSGRQVVVVGALRSGQWTLYAQNQTLPGNGPGDIRSARQIYPEP